MAVKNSFCLHWRWNCKMTCKQNFSTSWVSVCHPRPSSPRLSPPQKAANSHKNLITLLLLVSAFVLLWNFTRFQSRNFSNENSARKLNAGALLILVFVMNQNWIKLFRNYNSYRNNVLKFFRHVVSECRLVYLVFLTITVTFDNINQFNCLLGLRVSLF